MSRKTAIKHTKLLFRGYIEGKALLSLLIGSWTFISENATLNPDANPIINKLFTENHLIIFFSLFGACFKGPVCRMGGSTGRI